MSIYVDVAARYVAVHNLNCALIIEIRDMDDQPFQHIIHHGRLIFWCKLFKEQLL